MTTVVYYDLERVDLDHVVLGTAAAGEAGPVVHVRCSDAGWAVDGPVDAVTLPGPRASEFRAVLESVLARLAGRAELRLGAVDLLDVAWFDWFFAAQRAVHRAWALTTIAERFSPERVVWLGDDTDGSDALVRAGAALGCEVRSIDASGSERARPGRRWRRRLHTFADWYRLLVPPARTGTPGADQPQVALTEDFPHLAAMLVDAGQRLREEPGLAVCFVASRRSVLPTVASLDPLLLDHAVPRRVRVRSLVAAARAGREARRFVRVEVRAGVPELGAAAPAMGPGLADATASACGKAARATVLWSWLFRVSPPRVVVNATYTGNAANRAALCAAAAVGATRVFVQHGLVSDETWKTRLLHDRYLVWGPRARRRLLEAGAAPDAVVETGSLKLDRPREDPRPGSGRRVVYLPSRTGGRFVSESQAGELLAVVRDAAARLDVELTVKVHPDDRSALFERLGPIPVRRGKSGVTAMADADVVVISTSTAGFEACALGRPLVVLAPPGVEPPPEYAEFGAALMVDDGPGLHDALRTLLSDESAVAALREGQDRLVAQLLGPTDGRSGERIAREIAGLAREPCVPR